MPESRRADRAIPSSAEQRIAPIFSHGPRATSCFNTLPPPCHVTRLLVTLSTFVLGSVGWYLGEGIGIFSAFALSMVGTAVGVYVGKQVSVRWGG